jgi:tetratricopeptide (TPR) repeat protein
LNAALDRDSYMAHALLARGRLHEHEGRAADALSDYQRLLAAVDPREQVGPGFAAGLQHAAGVVQAANDALAARLDAAMADELAQASPASALRVRHAMEAQLGRRRVYVHQPLALHYPYLPAIQYFERDLFPWLAELEAATPAIRAELQAVLAAGGDASSGGCNHGSGRIVELRKRRTVGIEARDAWCAFGRHEGHPTSGRSS